MSTKAVSEHLYDLLNASVSEEEIRAQIEPRLGPGCTLNTWVENCITDSGTSGYRRCGSITGCKDPNQDTPPSCGGCMGQ